MARKGNPRPSPGTEDDSTDESLVPQPPHPHSLETWRSDTFRALNFHLNELDHSALPPYEQIHEEVITPLHPAVKHTLTQWFSTSETTLLNLPQGIPPTHPGAQHTLPFFTALHHLRLSQDRRETFRKHDVTQLLHHLTDGVLAGLRYHRRATGERISIFVDKPEALTAAHPFPALRARLDGSIKLQPAILLDPTHTAIMHRLADHPPVIPLLAFRLGTPRCAPRNVAARFARQLVAQTLCMLQYNVVLQREVGRTFCGNPGHRAEHCRRLRCLADALDDVYTTAYAVVLAGNFLSVLKMCVEKRYLAWLDEGAEGAGLPETGAGEMGFGTRVHEVEAFDLFVERQRVAAVLCVAAMVAKTSAVFTQEFDRLAEHW